MPNLFKNLVAAVGGSRAAGSDETAKSEPADQTVPFSTSQIRRPVVEADEDEDITHQTLSVAASRPMLRVVGALSGSPERYFVSPAGVTTIGRASDNDIVVATAAASVHHCRLIQKDKTFTLEDLGSTNKTWVNGKAIDKAVLRHGDEISVGDSVFVFALFGNRT
jgi:pSer/pThr/pTyr-binding forkhead associated (FHA) protein